MPKAARAAPIPAAAPLDRSKVVVISESKESRYKDIAEALTRPEIGAAAVIEAWSPNTHDVNDLAEVLSKQVAAVNGGKLERTEGILISQAQTLDAIFVNLMRRSVNKTSLAHWETYMRMGMKAQSQCRATLQALAEIKNPRSVAFVKQANINNGGQQQINNGMASDATPSRAHARENGNEQSKLLEGMTDGSTYMDTGTAGTAGRSDKAMESVGVINRTKKRGG